MSAQPQHVVIAGAGIIGLACALELAETGFRVTVLERGLAMREASWAAAGMLAVNDPENVPALLPLSRLSRRLYPNFLARVFALSGLAVPLRTELTLQGQRGALFEMEEASLDPRDLCAALPVAVLAAGVALRERCATVAVTDTETGVQVELADGALLEADAFVLACGAWSGQVRVRGGVELPIAPRKGQMVEVTVGVRGESPQLKLVIRTPELYLVPRGDGRIVIGATVEDAGYDRAVDVAAGDRMVQAAGKLWPPILHGRVTARWTGLRPAVVDGERGGVVDMLPVIGPMGPRVFVATGHFRNGILLAPGTARLIGECLRGESESVALAPFRASRFFLQERGVGEEILIQTSV